MGVKDRISNITPKTIERMAELVAVLHAWVKAGGDVVYLPALLGDDDVWTIRQEIQNLYDLTTWTMKRGVGNG